MGARLLQKFGGLLGLYKAGFENIQKEKGIGKAKAAQLMAAFELGRRVAHEEHGELPAIRKPEDAAGLLLYDMSGLNREELWVLVLNTRNQVLEKVRLYRGSVNSAQVRSAEVFKPAILRDATAIIVAHNHPSGDPTPSQDDIVLTRHLVQAGKTLDIEVLDHLVIGGMKFVSLKERKLGFY
jgi:DNA repair protein RadC